ncbi:MAG: hypothetical protein QNJ97_15815 [Myxococcota bacterium]|nr:hypothetical protein [Myxococcota bacterium]
MQIQFGLKIRLGRCMAENECREIVPDTRNNLGMDIHESHITERLFEVRGNEGFNSTLIRLVEKRDELLTPSPDWVVRKGDCLFLLCPVLFLFCGDYQFLWLPRWFGFVFSSSAAYYE